MGGGAREKSMSPMLWEQVGGAELPVARGEQASCAAGVWGWGQGLMGTPMAQKLGSPALKIAQFYNTVHLKYTCFLFVNVHSFYVALGK